MRGLSNQFITNLKSGFLCGLLDYIKYDDTLSLEIRNNYINIYYRGGNIIRLHEKRNNYEAFFNKKYCVEKQPIILELPETIISGDGIKKWIQAFPHIKHQMDLWFAQNPKLEREFQQLVMRENNSLSNTDYFICDIEYSDREGRFDMLAVRWDSSSSQRKNTQNIKFAFIEMKYGDRAVKGSAGLLAHVDSLLRYFDKGSYNRLTDEMVNVFNTKYELGLINITKPITSISEDKPELILLIANHDPSSEILLEVLRDGMGKGIFSNLPFEIKFSFSNFMGYGLYAPNIKTLDETINILEQFCKNQGRNR